MRGAWRNRVREHTRLTTLVASQKDVSWSEFDPPGQGPGVEIYVRYGRNRTLALTSPSPRLVRGHIA
jgi:hypothetical protein